jgi:AcrR family transcriptional regulator
MNDIATACGTSKARLYHYYDSKEAILFDLLDLHPALLLLIAQVEARPATQPRRPRRFAQADPQFSGKLKPRHRQPCCTTPSSQAPSPIRHWAVTRQCRSATDPGSPARRRLRRHARPAPTAIPQKPDRDHHDAVRHDRWTFTGCVRRAHRLCGLPMVIGMLEHGAA